MAIEVQITDEVDIEFSGIDAILAFSRGASIAADELLAAQVIPRKDAVSTLGWRIAGGYLPKTFATGWYSYRGRKGDRQLWCVYRDEEVLAIDLNREGLRRIVIQHPNRHRLCQRINELGPAAESPS